MSHPLSCTTCRVLRRTLVAFVLGGLLAWQLSGTLPGDPAGTPIWQGLMVVVIAFGFLNVFLRMRQLRARFRR